MNTTTPSPTLLIGDNFNTIETRYGKLSCPLDYPFAYLNGGYCCKTKEERPVSPQTPQNEIDDGTCDGVDFNRQSKCCKSQNAPCPNGSGCFDNSVGTIRNEKCSSSNANWSCCTSSNPCGENQGDCDVNSDCKSGLVCEQNKCPSGFPSSSYDCCAKPAGSDSGCFKKGLYVEGSIPMAMTFYECEAACEKTDCCKFISWFDPKNQNPTNANPDPNNKGSCGLRCFDITASVNAPGSIPSKKGISQAGKTIMRAIGYIENRVYVSRLFVYVTSKTQCQNYCTSDPQCNTVTFFEAAQKCALNYGPTFDKLEKLPDSDNLGWTAPKSCN